MAQLKDLIVNGATRLIGKLTTKEAQILILDVPEASNSSTFGPGENGLVLKTNGSSIYWGNDNNSGTVTSVRVQATSPITSSTSTAQTETLNTTIALADNYGDSKNPYASKTKNYVLAAPSSANGAPSFRKLVADDIPSITKSKISDFPTSMTPTSHSHGNITNSGTITSTTVSPTAGDAILISDTDNSGKIERSIAFTATGGGAYLSQLGSWTIPTQCSIVTLSASNTTYHINSRSQNNTIIKVTPNTSAGVTNFSLDTEDTESLTRFPIGGFLYIFINGAGVIHFTTDTGTATLYDGYEARTLNTGTNAAATLLSSKDSTIIKLIRLGLTEWVLENYNTGQAAYGGVVSPIESDGDIQPQYNNEILNVTKTCTLTIPASDKYLTTSPYTGHFRSGFRCWIRCNGGTTTITPASGISLRYFIPSTGTSSTGSVKIRGANGMAMLAMINNTTWSVNGDIVAV